MKPNVLVSLAMIIPALLSTLSPAVAEEGTASAEFREYRLLGKLDRVVGGEKYHFTIGVQEKAPGWALLLDPFPFEKRKKLTDAERKRWTRAGVNTVVKIELTNKSKTIIDVAESPVPFSSDSVKSGETITVTMKDFSHQMVIRKLRGTHPDPEWIEFDITLTFADDIDWPGGIHFGTVYVAVMHRHPEWFHISTRQRNWKKNQKKNPRKR